VPAVVAAVDLQAVLPDEDRENPLPQRVRQQPPAVAEQADGDGEGEDAPREVRQAVEGVPPVDAAAQLSPEAGEETAALSLYRSRLVDLQPQQTAGPLPLDVADRPAAAERQHQHRQPDEGDSSPAPSDSIITVQVKPAMLIGRLISR